MGLIRSLPQIFSDLLPAEALSTDPQICSTYGKDWCKNFTGNTPLVLFPRSTAEVQAIVRRANEQKIALVPSGGRTGLSGGATATNQEVVISLSRMNSILDISPISRLARVQAGVVTQQLQEKVAEHNLLLPIEFTAQGSSQIGGNISTNVGGVHVVRYGSMRSWVRGLTVVTGKGDILSFNGELVKDNSGYDLKELFIGSEGTLGIITEATIALTRPRRDVVRFLLAVPELSALPQILQRSRDTFASLAMVEYFADIALKKVLLHQTRLRAPFQENYPHYLLVEVETSETNLEPFLASLLEENLVLDGVIANSSEQNANLLGLRESIGETLSSHYTPHKNDIAVPVTALPSFLLELETLLAHNHPTSELVVFGHLGDGNLHVNILKPTNQTAADFFARCKELDPLLYALVAQYHGTVSAEHGVGLLKKEYLHFCRSPEELEYFRAIKRVFDPLGILNPGKVIPS